MRDTRSSSTTHNGRLFIYERAKVPRWLLAAIRAAIEDELIHRGRIRSDYLLHSMELATWVAAAVCAHRVVALATLVDSSEHELGLDVVCSEAEHRPAGRDLIAYVIAFARRRGKAVLAVFATPGARPVWIKNWGFRERLVRYDPSQHRWSYGRLHTEKCQDHGGCCECHRLQKIIGRSRDDPAVSVYQEEKER